MLAQLVCLDRRYQRMNCFNIRELQTLLKNRYHPELLDEKLHTDFLSQTTLSTRFKLFDLNVINPRMALFNEFPLFNNFSTKTTQFTGANDFRKRQHNLADTYNLNYFGSKILTTYKYYSDKFSYYYYSNPTVTPFYQFYVSQDDLNVLNIKTTSSEATKVTAYETTLTVNNEISSQNLFNLPSFELASFGQNLLRTIQSNIFYPLTTLLKPLSFLAFEDFFVALTTLYSSALNLILTNSTVSDTKTTSTIRSSQSVNIESLHSYAVNGSHELATDYRFQKTQNPVFRYDFKVGHYMTEPVKTLNRHIFITFNDVTGGLRVAP